MARAKSTATLAVAGAVAQAITGFNADNGQNWTFGTNWDATNSDFETFTNKYLFPKLNETAIVNVALGNRFDWLAVETDFIGQYSEEYVILDSVPVELALDQNATLMLERNYPNIATKLYGSGILKKLKFTLNDNIQRQQFATLGDAVSYAVNVYKKQISNINVEEEREIKGMLIDYIDKIKSKRKINSPSSSSYIYEVYNTVLNFQSNSSEYNEASTASGGALGRFTTQTPLEDIMIITNDYRKVDILNSQIANVFNSSGLDITDHVLSFPSLNDVYKTKKDYTLVSGDITKLKALGNYTAKVGDIIPKGTVFTSKEEMQAISIPGSDYEPIIPGNDQYATIIMDVKALRYKRYTKNMLKPPFYNGEFDEVTYWIHYYSMKAISPFYNKAIIYSQDSTVDGVTTLDAKGAPVVTAEDKQQ